MVWTQHTSAQVKKITNRFHEGEYCVCKTYQSHFWRLNINSRDPLILILTLMVRGVDLALTILFGRQFLHEKLLLEPLNFVTFPDSF